MTGTPIGVQRMCTCIAPAPARTCACCPPRCLAASSWMLGFNGEFRQGHRRCPCPTPICGCTLPGVQALRACEAKGERLSVLSLHASACHALVLEALGRVGAAEQVRLKCEVRQLEAGGAVAGVRGR